MHKDGIKNCLIEVWLYLQIQSYQCIISIELFLNSLSYFVVLFLSQTLQGLQTLKQHYFFKNAHCMINGQKKDSNQVYCICFFSFFQLCPKLYTTYSQAISVGFPLHLDPSSKSSIMRKWTEWLNCCKLEIVQFGKWQRKLKILRLLLIPFWLAVGTLTSKLQDARKSRVNRWRVQPRLPWSLTPWIQWRNFCD